MSTTHCEIILTLSIVWGEHTMLRGLYVVSASSQGITLSKSGTPGKGGETEVLSKSKNGALFKRAKLHKVRTPRKPPIHRETENYLTLLEMNGSREPCARTNLVNKPCSRKIAVRRYDNLRRFYCVFVSCRRSSTCCRFILNT